MDGLVLLYGKFTFSPQILLTTLTDTCDCANVNPMQTFDKLRQNRYIEKLIRIENTTISIVKKASGQLVSFDTEASVPFKFGNQCFYENFFVLKSANPLILSTLSSQNKASK